MKRKKRNVVTFNGDAKDGGYSLVFDSYGKS